jgi:hypothetical protein
MAWCSLQWAASFVPLKLRLPPVRFFAEYVQQHFGGVPGAIDTTTSFRKLVR